MPEQTPDLRTLMQNPYFLMGARMMGANQGKGMAAGPAAGQAAVGAAGDLQRIETASANRTWRNKQSAIQEERNRIAQEMQQRNLELKQKTLDENVRANAAKEGMYETMPTPLEGGGWWTPARGVQGASVDPMKQMLASMMGAGTGASTLSGPQSPAYTPAPQQAIEMLKANPDLAPQFQAKYGYIPR